MLLTDGANSELVKSNKSAIENEGATVKIIAPKIGGVSLSDKIKFEFDGQLAVMPSVLFDAVVLVLSDKGCQDLMKDSAAIDFVSHAFVHLKVIGMTAAAQPLLDKAGVIADGSIIDISQGVSDFIKSAASQQWDREPKVRPVP